MHSISRFVQPFRRSMSDQVDRLHQTLASLCDRLRSSVLQAVADTVVRAVRDAVHLVFSEFSLNVGTPWPGHRPVHSPRAFWDHEDELLTDELDDWPLDHDPNDLCPDEDDDPPDSSDQTSRQEAKPRRWIWALAAGFDASSWWLRRQAARCSLMTVLGIGAASTMAAWVAGPGLIGSALRLMTLAEVVQASAGALVGLGN